jgi:hypothetical protein
MAKLAAPLPGARRLALRGAYYTRTWRGLVIAQAWPRKRNIRRTLTQRAREDFIRNSIWAIRYTDAAMVELAQKTFAKSQILWRDQLTSTYAGTMWAGETTDGRKFWPMRFVKLISRSLDVFRPATGALLARGPNIWQAINPAAAGARLTSQGPGQPPKWL